MRMPRQTKFTDYEGFVEKFKPKKTTDDCYTPPAVYDAVLTWCRENIKAVREATEIVRPFYPGGDYEAYDYPDGSVVVDNPPFSILASIVDNYEQNGIRFVLFAPHLTLFSTMAPRRVTAIVADLKITYSNGAKVDTAFLTNCWDSDAAVAIRGDLKDRIKIADARARGTAGATQPPKRIIWPENVTSSALLGKCLTKETMMEIPRTECRYLRKMDKGQLVFGGGLLVSDRVAAELRAAELRAAELRAAELRKDTRIELSEKELRIIAELNEAAEANRQKNSHSHADD